MSTTLSARRGVSTTLLSAQSALNANVGRAIPSSFDRHQIILTGSAGIASGAVTIETSDDPDYAGTWAQPAGGAITVAASTKYTVNFNGAYKFIRVRISTVFVGGTVTATYLGA